MEQLGRAGGVLRLMRGRYPGNTTVLLYLLCYHATQTRSRRCDQPAPLYGGRPCPGPAVDSLVCSVSVCPGESLAASSAGNWVSPLCSGRILEPVERVEWLLSLLRGRGALPHPQLRQTVPLPRRQVLRRQRH